MEKINNYWVDDNNNRWSCDLETEESSQIKSNTLINCRNCTDCSGCSGCLSCSNCSDCLSCSNFKTNPQRYTTSKIGSRHAQTTFYWTSKNDVQVVCGCYRGNLKEFEERVKQKHKETEHLIPYLNEVKKVKYLMKE